MDIRKFFKEHMIDNLNLLVFEYDINSSVCESKGFGHIKDDDFEERFIDLLINHIVFYSFEEDELINEYNRNRLDDLRKAAVAAYNKRIPKTERKNDGLLGELVLDMVLKSYYPIEMLYARIKYIDQVPTKDYKKEVKGYDSLCFSMNDGKPSIWIGQIKTGDKTYCYKNIKDDLAKNLLHDYFSDSMLIMADNLRSKSNTIINLINDINDIQYTYSEDKKILFSKVIEYFKSKNIEVIMPSMMLYESKKYDNINFIKDLEEEIKDDIISNFKDYKFINQEGLNAKVIILVFTVRDLHALREKLLNFRLNVAKA